MSSVVDDLATIPGIQVYLEDSPFATHRVERLSGGSGNFTYRLHLCRPFDGCQTLVLKYAPPYAAASAGHFPLDQHRQFVEVQALRLVRQLTIADIHAFVKVPAIHLFDEERHVVIMDDAGEDSRTLKELLIGQSLPKNVSEQIGTALGKFICAVHTCNQKPGTDMTVFASSQVGKFIAIFVTYGQVESTLTGRDSSPALSDPLLEIPEMKMSTISKLVERRKQAIYAASTSDPLVHGDFWPGNMVVSLRRSLDGTVEGVNKLYILDWEVSKTGVPGLDLGQLCAEMYTLSEFYPAREGSTRTIVESFLGAYREQKGTKEDVELARTVASHIGAHLVAVTPRVSSWSDRQKVREVVEKGVEMMVLGEEGSELALRASIVGPLL